MLWSNWKVEKNIVFQRVTATTEQDFEEHLRQEDECSHAIFTIDSTGIKNVTRACDFLGCIMNCLNAPLEPLNVIEDNSYTQQAMGDEIADSNIIGRGFVNMLDSNYREDTILYLDTRCQVDFGNTTLILLVIDRNKVGLYQGYNLIVLARSRE